MFSAPRADYDIVFAPGVVTVIHARNIVRRRRNRHVEERRELQFSDLIVSLGTPVASISTAALNFGTRSTVAPAVTLPVTVTNTGNGDLTVTGAAVTGADAASFSAVNGCATVVPGASCTISVSFQATTVGAKTAQLDITHNAVGSPHVVALTGTGVLNTPAVGVPAILDLTPTEGSAVTVSTSLITDADGLIGVTPSVQWQQNNIGGGGAVFTAIPGATSLSFTPQQGQVNRRLRVVATFVDNHGTTEVVTSASTTVVGDLFPGVGDSNAGIDTLAGTAGDDNYSGGNGADSLTTQAGDDLVSGDAGDDTINTGGGADTIRFSGVNEGFDAVTGGADADVITATSANTNIGLSSLATVETITSGGFANVNILGSAAANTLDFSGVTLSGIGFIDGGNGPDIITGSGIADVIFGGNGADTLNGGNGADTLDGGAGVDTINGNAGDDIITGGAGNDNLNGQAGQNVFRFLPGGFGADIIVGFDANPTGGQDKLDMSGLGITAATFGANVSIAAGPIAGSTLVTIAGHGTIQLNGVAPANVNVTDFTLAP